MRYDAVTRVAKLDPNWAGPFPLLYDDGPWNAGGHEPIGNVAGDGLWGVTVFVRPPVNGAELYEYGLDDSTLFNSWLWPGRNGTFSVAAFATEPITVTGLTMPRFGLTDFVLVINTNALTPRSPAWDLSSVHLTGNRWAWTPVQLFDDGTRGDEVAGDGRYTFQLSRYLGVANSLPHSGLVSSGDVVEFIFSFGPREYRDSLGQAITAGVSASVIPPRSSPITASVSVKPGSQITSITVP